MQVAGERTRGVDDDVLVADDRVERADDLALGGPGGRVGGGEGPVHQRLPPRLARRVLGLVRAGDPVPGEGRRQRLQAGARVGDHGVGGELVGVEGGDVEAHEADAGRGEERRGGGGEVGVAGADADHQVGGAGELVGDGRAGVADAADVRRVVVAQRALARLGGGDGDAGGVGERAQRVLRLAVVDAAARDDQGAFGGPYEARGLGERPRVRGGARHVPGPVGEELLGPVVRLGLYVLRQREGDRAGLDGVGEHPHGLEGGGDQRLRPVHAVEVAGDGPQRVVDRHVARAGDFELLEDGVGGAGGEGVAGEQEHREAVDGGQRRAGGEVGGAGADGGGDGVRGEPVALPGVADGGVHHGLFVAALEVGQRAFGLQERLADARDVAVAEDAPAGADEPAALPVPLGVLVGEELHQGLRDGAAAGRTSGRGGGHRAAPDGAAYSGSRGSAGCSGQVARSHAWSGWSRISQARSSPGPAMTLR